MWTEQFIKAIVFFDCLEHIWKLLFVLFIYVKVEIAPKMYGYQMNLTSMVRCYIKWYTCLLCTQLRLPVDWICSLKDIEQVACAPFALTTISLHDWK